jgi:hypothetical protein
VSPRIASHPSFPSVTEVLQSAGLVRDYRNLDDRYSLLGTALHETIAWHHAGTLDESSIHPEVKPGFEAYLEWCQMASHRPLYSELELAHPHGFVGHIDRAGSVGSVEMALIDWTYSDSPDLRGKRWQLAGYRLLWDYQVENNVLTTYPPASRCYVVALQKDGTPRCHDVTDDFAMTVFNAALIVETAKRSK